LRAALVAAAGASAVVLLSMQTASAAIVPISGTTLQGSGPTTWDMGTNDTGCALTGFTPVVDGAFGAKDDAFDNGLVVGVNGTGFDDSDANAGMAAVDQATTSNSTAFAPVSVTRWDRALHTSPTLRTLVKFTNTGATGTTLDVGWDSDLGSDANTVVRFSSNGDTTYQAGDRWAVSADSTTAPTDPPLTFVLFGKQALVRPTVATALGNAQTCFTIDYSLHLKAGATRYLLFFTEMHATAKSAHKSALKFDALAPGSALLTGIKPGVLPNIANWNL
jgi:hypothetical protein